MTEREFPILRDRRASSTGRRSVPWAWVAPHETQARRNHGGQTLERLAERGGLSPVELYCVVHAWPLSAILRREVTDDQAEAWIATWDGAAPGVVTPR